MNHDKKAILITGGAGGIGATVAKNFALRNYNIIINYFKSGKKAISLSKEINDLKNKETAFAFKADIRQRSEVKNMFEFAHQKFGQVDVLINNAGLNIDRPFLEMNDEEWTKVLSTILFGTFICSQEFARQYKGNSGHVINIGALTAIHGRKNGANYCCARAGVLNLTKCMALELAPKIKVNCVTPGWIETEELTNRYHFNNIDNYKKAVNTIPLKKLGSPDDIFRMINFIVNESSYITGQNFFVDGGFLMY
jgi:NAD(P)-dependent dehydrogenase (short-subunit alcohol dehydrogenase family)